MLVAACCRKPSAGVFANNAASELLRGGQPHSMKDMVRSGLSLIWVGTAQRCPKGLPAPAGLACSPALSRMQLQHPDGGSAAPPHAP